MILEKEVKKENLYTEYLRLINGILKLTDKECELVALFLEINDRDDNVFSAENRKYIQSKAKVSEMNLNNHIAHLKKKKVISEKDGILEVSERIVPSLYGDGDIVVAFRLNVI